MIIWGQTKNKIPIGTPPYATVYTVNLNEMKVLGSHTTTRGPFEVNFDSLGIHALVDEFLIDASKGRLTSTELKEDTPFTPESCEHFPGKTLY